MEVFEDVYAHHHPDFMRGAATVVLAAASAVFAAAVFNAPAGMMGKVSIGVSLGFFKPKSGSLALRGIIPSTLDCGKRRVILAGNTFDGKAAAPGFAP